MTRMGRTANRSRRKPIVVTRYHFKQDVEGYLSGKHAHLFLFDIASKQLKKLTTDDKYEEDAAEWAPDGKLIAFVSNHTMPDPDRSTNTDIFVVDAKPGSTVRQLTTFSGEDFRPYRVESRIANSWPIDKASHPVIPCMTSLDLR